MGDNPAECWAEGYGEVGRVLNSDEDTGLVGLMIAKKFEPWIEPAAAGPPPFDCRDLGLQVMYDAAKLASKLSGWSQVTAYRLCVSQLFWDGDLNRLSIDSITSKTDLKWSDEPYKTVRTRASTDGAATKLLAALKSSSTPTTARDTTLESDLANTIEEIGFAPTEEGIESIAAMDHSSKVQGSIISEDEEEQPHGAEDGDADGCSIVSEGGCGEPSLLDFDEVVGVQGLKEIKCTGSRMMEFAFLDTGEPAGFIHKMDNDIFNLRCTCSHHKKCVCWVRVKSDAGYDTNSVLESLVKWLGSRSLSAEAHQELAAEVKTGFGMEIRKKKS